VTDTDTAAQRLGQAPCPLLDLRFGHGGVAEQQPAPAGRLQRVRGQRLRLDPRLSRAGGRSAVVGAGG
jgi:hypothetical protein